MRKLVLQGFFILSVALPVTQQVYGQQKIQYQLCARDFRPLYMRQNLPKNAVYTDTTATDTTRAHDVIKRLTFQEKLRLTGGWNYMYFPGLSRLGLRPIRFSDASQGIRISQYGIKHPCIQAKKSTSFPAELALAASWDPGLAYRYAKSIGEESRAWGISVLLGPALNMYRNSEGGRNFEYMGEDPFLTSTMAVHYVKGLQSTGTLATLKHLIGNEQEFARHIANVEIGERALREIYLRPFWAAINNGGAMAVMAGNNFVNEYPGAANKPISEGILRKKYGYKGIIMSDWANSTFWPERQDLVLGSGQSLMMSDNKIFANYIQNEIKQHPAKKESIREGLDTMVFHNLYTFFKMGFYDRPYRDPALVKKIERHKKTALQTAEEAITLLKNEDHILPIDPHKVNKIVVLGTDKALRAATGTGSGHVNGYDQIDYLSGLKKTYGNKVVHKKDINDNEIETADVVLYFINKKSGEGYDVPFDMPTVNKKIIPYSKLNEKLVVIYSGGSGLAIPWLSQTKALVFAYLLGQQSGTAMANVISGRVNPSGKLPFTIEKRFMDSPSYGYNIMKDGNHYWKGHGKSDKEYRKQFGDITISYKEGIYMGYRWFEKKNIQSRFPFGFGLSYTRFKIYDIKASSTVIKENEPIRISFKIKNTGKTGGAEVAQLYIYRIDPAANRPLKELKGFKKVFLNPGECQTVTIPVHLQDLAFWSTKEHQWNVSSGEYSIEVGTSVEDIRQKTSITKQ